MTVFASEHNAHTFDFGVRVPIYLLCSKIIIVLHLQPGDIGYIPPAYGEPTCSNDSNKAFDKGGIPIGHYVENIGNTTLKYLEIFKSSSAQRFLTAPSLAELLFTHAGLYEDISLTQWLALTPPELVKAHLGFSNETIAKLSTTKHQVVG